jgi:hypothetical protein
MPVTRIRFGKRERERERERRRRRNKEMMLRMLLEAQAVSDVFAV